MASYERRRALAPAAADFGVNVNGAVGLDGSVPRRQQTYYLREEQAQAERAERSEVDPPAAAPTLTGTVLIGEREHRMYILRSERIDYIEGHGNYVKIHAGHAEYISRDSVKRLSTVLVSSGFLRIERSLLVNVRAIQYAERVGRGTYAFTLNSGERLCSGATYREAILRVLPLPPALRPRS
jgi:DNA-binding LytR/AlgR family response regulator